MELKVKKIDLGAGRPVAFLNEITAKRLNIHIGERIDISFSNKRIIAVVDIVKSFLGENEISLSEEVISYLKLKSGESVRVSLALEPKSIRAIIKKLNGKSLSKKEILCVVKDIVNNSLTEAEIAYFVSGVYEKGMSMEETIYLTEAMYKTGQVLKWGNKRIVDKHSIGGIAGNRTTPIVISICAAAGLIMPKTSSRAITSPAGTADTMETITRIEFTTSELKKIVNKVGACLVWGGSLGMAPADDKLIHVERLLGLDPESQLLASIMSKKLAVGSKYVLIDIPQGQGAKVSKEEAEKLKKKFISIGKHFHIHVEVVTTDGSQPIGNGIGPVLEMRDIMRVLRRDNPPKDLEEKSLFLAGKIFEMTDKTKKGKGAELARKILESGQAFNKFKEIISAQGKKDGFLREAKLKHEIKSSKTGAVKSIDNKSINYLARILGCPIDKASGIYLYKHRNDKVCKGENLLTLYSESDKKLKEALAFFRESKPIEID
jgi:AMP phosphorylase